MIFKMTDAVVLGPLIVFRSKPRHRELNRRNSTGFHRRAPHPRLVILMLVLAIKLSQGGKHASNFINSEREYKHKHFHNYEKTGSTLWCLTEFRRYFLTVPRKPPLATTKIPTAPQSPILFAGILEQDTPSGISTIFCSWRPHL